MMTHAILYSNKKKKKKADCEMPPCDFLEELIYSI